ncbi:MAG: sugar transferase [Candidatus Omnitrophica bacterium]|nr:sugar transferase [Candidatus Omnitrophota bacterium]
MKQSKTYFGFRSFLVVLADLVCLTAALVGGYWLWKTFAWHGHYQYFSDYVLTVYFLPLAGVVIFRMGGLYKAEAGLLGVEEQSLIFKAIVNLFTLFFAISFFYRRVEFSRLAVFYSFFLAVIFVSVSRYLLRQFFSWLNRRGHFVRKALIYGAGYHGQRLERWIQQSPKLGLHVVGYLDDDVDRLRRKPSKPWLGKLEDLRREASKHHVTLLFIAYPKLEESKVVEIFQFCRKLEIQCWAIPVLYQFHIEKAEIANIGGIPLMTFREKAGRRFYRWVKGWLDTLMAWILLVPAGLLVLGLYGVLKRISREPVFFRQVRVGIEGKRFVMYKFRTLKSKGRRDRISPELAEGKQRESSEILPLGGFLRRTGLDELPQLFNVLKGEMSLVGPRPEMPFIVDKYGPLERERLSVKPGITGLWQISEDRKRLLIHENMDYDLYYIEHLSPYLDLAILVKTFVTVFSRFLRGGNLKSKS